MYFSLKSDCYFRHYGTIGYITRPIISTEEIVDECGSVFMKQLQYEPQSLEVIVDKLSKVFCDTEVETLKTDAIEFYMNLVKDGFLNYSESLQDFKNVGFEYSTLRGKLTPTSFKSQLEESSSHFLGEYSRWCRQ